MMISASSSVIILGMVIILYIYIFAEKCELLLLFTIVHMSHPHTQYYLIITMDPLLGINKQKRVEHSEITHLI